MVTFAFVTGVRPFAFAECSNAGFFHTSNGILLFLMSARRFCTTSNGIFANLIKDFKGSVANSTIPYVKRYFKVLAKTKID